MTHHDDGSTLPSELHLLELVQAVKRGDKERLRS